ncbi:alpha/beta fold hydrolase [Tepidiforma thermophila]|uniref:Pimeloyl-ACP methyl ester carboxylesterase n=1 Tax=Tepidiforma thermophila (strain KCTC 52669 / CGMCC 1.13589 / G233) TaxID=2761530 RepID=A0A2A9HHG8_TEPT2|nr:alpha/beta hydrolase [Tepidiforma thermophila]PFG74540.1 pimeloyl-ACP methyl ester carboxylesterase [Tepidiforma thermophila]
MAGILAYADTGRGGPPLLFIHGLCCDRRAWDPQIADLSRDHRCIAVDLRGRGATPAVPPFGIRQAAADIAELLDDLEVGPAVLIGHSLGGITALVVNDLRPDRVIGIVTGDSPISAPRADGSGANPLVQRIRELGTKEGLRPLIETFFTAESTPEARAYVDDVMYQCPAEVAAGMLEDAPDVLASLPELVRKADQKPLMAIWAERPLGDPAWLRSVTKFVRQEPIAGAGHFFQLEQPAVTSALLRAFLNDVASDPRIR